MASENPLKALRTFCLFNEKVDKLHDLSFKMKLYMWVADIIECHEGKKDRGSITHPDDESIDAVVLTLRLFMQDNESISLRNIAALYSQISVNSALAEHFSELRSTFNGYLDRASVIGEKGIANREILELFVYGSLAHTTQDKAVKLDEFRESGDLGELKAQFAVILSTFLSVLASMKSVNERTIRELVGRLP